ncbi:MAG: BCCT family transporter [Spirochaetaceae bacterium]
MGEGIVRRKQGVFIVSLLIVVVLVGYGVAAPDKLDNVSEALHGGIIEHFGWAYLLAAFFFLVFSVAIAASKYGRIKLGKDHEKPQYSYFGWFSMLFAAGMGIGLIFWGVAEPLNHYLNPPEYLAGTSGDAARFAMTHSFFHWGLHPWGIYIVMSLCIAYFSFRRGMPPLISSTFYPLLGERIYRWPGYLIDILAVFATVFGIATSLGLGALQITGGVAEVLPVAGGRTDTLVVIAVVTVLFIVSSATGLDKGVQILSKANVLIAVMLLAFMLLVGPTSYIFNVFTSTLGEYIASLVPMSLSTNPFRGYEWTKAWTLFYWAWWISWSPFVGLFVASISRGRTIREFILGALLVPTLLTFVWFAVFGGAAFHLQLAEGIDLAGSAVSDVSAVLFELFGHYPFSAVLSLLTVLLLGVFFVTSADSATFVLSMMTSEGSLTPSLRKKVTWGLLVSAAAAVLLVSGGLEALQRMAIVAALPFTIVMLLMTRSLYKAMRYELTVERAAEAQATQAATGPEGAATGGASGTGAGP